MSKQRFLWLDYAKGIAILLVVYRHVFEGIKRAGVSVSNYQFLEYANIALFSFRMPLFFIISGVFISKSLAKRGLNRFIATKSKTILYPYFFWGILQISLQLLLADYVNAERTVKDYTYLFYMPRMLEHFWYLLALFNVTLLYALLKVKAGFGTHTQLITGLVFYFLFTWLKQADIETGFVADILHYYIFFAIGDRLAGLLNKPGTTEKAGTLRWMLLALPVFAAAQYYFLVTNLKHADMKFMFVEYFQPVPFLLIALIGSFFMLVTAMWLQKTDKLVWLRKVGYYSLYIYVAHVLAASATRLLLTKLAGIDHVLVLLPAGIIMGCLLPVLLYKFTERMGWYWMFTLERKKGSSAAD